MPAPTRPQIEATIALPTYTIQVDTGAGYTNVTDSEVSQINGKMETTANHDNAFAFGTVARADAQVTVADTTTISPWEESRIRILFGFDTSDQVVAFEGIIVKRQHVGHFYVYDCRGFDYVIERKKIYTGVFYKRPIATKTTASSVEDYTIPGSRPGIINRILFTVGGRPYEQPGYATDPDFKFWYSCDQSIVAPRYAWVSGEDAWEEIFRLVRAAGGQFYQDVDGVFYYKQPLTFGYVDPLATLYHFTESTYETISEEASTVENLDTIKSAYVERTLQPMQQVFESTTPKLLPDNETTDMPLEMQYPVYTYADYVTNAMLIRNKSAIKAVYFDGRDATEDYVDFTVNIATKAAQLVDLEFDNATGEPIALSRIVLEGRPITAGSEGVASYTNGDGSELQLEDNIYIQSFAQAYRLVRMFYDFYHTNRAIITLDGVGFDPDRYLGEVVELTYTAWGLSAARHRIIGLEYKNGATMTVTLAPISGLVTRDQVFIVNDSYADATIRMVSY